MSSAQPTRRQRALQRGLPTIEKAGCTGSALGSALGALHLRRVDRLLQAESVDDLLKLQVTAADQQARLVASSRSACSTIAGAHTRPACLCRKLPSGAGCDAGGAPAHLGVGFYPKHHLHKGMASRQGRSAEHREGQGRRCSNATCEPRPCAALDARQTEVAQQL